MGKSTGGISMNKVIEKLKQIGVIPLAVFKDEKQAVPVANALSKARIDTLEVTLRTEKGVKAIEEIKEKLSRISCRGRHSKDRTAGKRSKGSRGRLYCNASLR